MDLNPGKKKTDFLNGCKKCRRADSNIYSNNLGIKEHFSNPKCTLKCNTSLLALHGKLHQLRRMAIYDEFCKKEFTGVLIATDVAARGLGKFWHISGVNICPKNQILSND